MRRIILDTETTGLNPAHNKIIEIGAIETFDYIPSGNVFNVYLDPLMEVDQSCTNICGITNEMLVGKPLFKEVVNELDRFLGDSPIVAHNARFDMSFINKERELIGLAPLKNKIIDTLQIAREVFPGMPNSLDALCKRFKISLAKREKHGALIDSELLAKVFFFLMEKKQQEVSLFDLEEEKTEGETIDFNRLLINLEEKEEIDLHHQIMKKINPFYEIV